MKGLNRIILKKNPEMLLRDLGFNNQHMRIDVFITAHIDGLVQERHNFIVNALELHLFLH